MAYSKDLFESEEIFAAESQEEECEPVWIVPGPPFDPRDYMISPSESCLSLIPGAPQEEEEEKKKKKLKPGDIHIDEKYLPDSHRALQKLAFLVKDGFAHNFVDRLKELIKIFLRGSPCGFRVCDLPFIIEVIEYFSRNKSLVPEYTDFVVDIMCCAKEPPKIGKASDTLYCKHTLADYFTLFGELLATFDNNCIQLQLLKALEVLLIRHGVVDISCVKLSSCHEAMEESELPCIITSLMETVPDKLYIYYLEAALRMILISQKAAYKMIQGNILEYILRRLEITYQENSPKEKHEYYRLLDRSSFIVRGLIRNICKYKFDAPVPGEKALWSFMIVFQREVEKKFQRAAEARNNLAGILLQLISVFGEKLSLDPPGLLKGIAALAVATEIKPEISWVSDINMGANKEDYILKQFMLLCCGLLVKNKNIAETLNKYELVEGLLRLIKQEATVLWLPSQAIKLLTISLRILSEIVPQLPETFIKGKGNERILDAIKWLMEQSLHEETLLEALKTLTTVVTSGEKSLLEDVKACGGVSLLLELGCRLLDIPHIKLLHQEKLARVLLSLDRMLSNDCECQNAHKEQCVSLSVKLLERIIANSEKDSKWSPAFLLSFGGFLWEALAWSKSALKSFIEAGGIFLLLDFIEVASFPLQMLFLGVLVDMTDEGGEIGHLLTWRGKNGYGLMSMMINIWRKEEYMTKVHRTKEGFIVDLDAPLMTEEQWYLLHQFPDSHLYSPSIAEMMCSARPKIHALYQFLMERYFDLTQIGESSYHMEVTAVAPSDSVYIPLLEHYLALKMGEVWHEVLRMANITGISPLIFNGRTICSLIDHKNKWALRIKTMQEEIALEEKLKSQRQEKDCYSSLKSLHLPGALEALNELEFITRSSFKEFQARKKEKQTLELERSLLPFATITNKLNFHTTHLKQKFTCFGFDFWIKSEKEAVETEIPRPVSPAITGESRIADANDF